MLLSRIPGLDPVPRREVPLALQGELLLTPLLVKTLSVDVGGVGHKLIQNLILVSTLPEAFLLHHLSAVLVLHLAISRGEVGPSQVGAQRLGVALG